MNDYDDTNTGVLFKNDKAGNPKRPDYRGSMNWGGEERWLSAWVKKSGSGQSFMSIAVGDLKEPRREDAGPTPPDDFDDDLPF